MRRAKAVHRRGRAVRHTCTCAARKRDASVSKQVQTTRKLEQLRDEIVKAEEV
jgi:hypothetical protein